MIKRNDKCHCGSGKKYKSCCMEKDKLEKINRLNNDALDKKKTKMDKNYTDSIIKLSTCLENTIINDEEFTKYEEEARKKFFSEDSSTEMISNRFFATYFLYDYLIKDEITPAMYILNKNSKKFSNDEKRIILNCINSYPSLFVIDSIVDREVVVKELFSGRRYRTLDSKILGEFDEGDYIVARPVLIDDTYILIDLTVRIQEETKDIIYNSIMDVYNSNNTANLSIDTFIMINSLFFYKYMVQLLQMSNYMSDEKEDIEDRDEDRAEKTKDISDDIELAEKLAVDIEETICTEDPVLSLLRTKISDEDIIKNVENIWSIVSSSTEITGSENGWAAGLEYYCRKTAGETITQNELASKYGVSASTLAKRNKEIAKIVSAN